MKISNKLFTSKYSGIIISITYFIVYITTIPSVNVGYADSDGFLATGNNLGLMQPPGYPLEIIILHIFKFLPIPINPTFKMNLSSAVLSTLTIFLIYQTLWIINNKLLEQFNLSKYFLNKLNIKILTTVISIFAVSALGSNFLFWQYSIIAEKYALNNLFSSIILFIGIKILIDKKDNFKKYLSILLLIFGLSLLHHQTIILYSPAILYLVYTNRKKFIKNIPYFSANFIVGLIIGILALFYVNNHISNISWHFDANVNGFIYQILRLENSASGIVDTTGQNRNLYLINPNINEIFNKIPELIILFISHFGIISSLIFIIGLISFYFYNKRISIYSYIIFFFTTFFIPIYLKWPNTNQGQALIMRMFLLGYIIVPIFIDIGIISIILYLKRKINKNLLIYIIVTLLSITILKLKNTYPKVNLKNFYFNHHLYSKILNSLQPNAMIMCDSDTSCFSLIYLQEVENIRSDVIVLTIAYPMIEDRLNKFPDLHGFNYPDNPFLLMDYISWNIDKRPVYATDLHTTHRNMLGMQYGFLKYIPMGLYGKIEKGDNLSEGQSKNFHYFTDKEHPKIDKMKLYFIENIAQQYALNARSFKRLNDNQKANEQYKLAKNIAPRIGKKFSKWLDDFGKEINTITGYQEIIPGNNNPTNEQIYEEININIELNRPDKAFFSAIGPVLTDPRNIKNRQHLAEFFKKINDIKMYNIEIENIKKLNK